MTEVSSGGAIADHHATLQQHRAGTAYLRSLTVVMTMPGGKGGGFRAVLIRCRMGYFCSDWTVWKAKLHSTDGVPIQRAFVFDMIDGFVRFQNRPTPAPKHLAHSVQSFLAIVIDGS
jgi:hypothetical protein